MSALWAASGTKHHRELSGVSFALRAMFVGPKHGMGFLTDDDFHVLLGGLVHNTHQGYSRH
jgi:hypothetical protein